MVENEDLIHKTHQKYQGISLARTLSAKEGSLVQMKRENISLSEKRHETVDGIPIASYNDLYNRQINAIVNHFSSLGHNSHYRTIMWLLLTQLGYKKFVCVDNGHFKACYAHNYLTMGVVWLCQDSEKFRDIARSKEWLLWFTIAMTTPVVSL